MNILIAAATEGEISAFRSWLDQQPASTIETDVLITGVGMMQTAWALSRRLAARKYDLAIQAGVAGSYNRNIALGEIVAVTSDTFGDTGAEDNGSFLDIFDMDLIPAQNFPFTGSRLRAGIPEWAAGLRKAEAITVNTVAGTAETIAFRQQRYAADLESMEGAAFHYACLMEGIPFVQVRAISNYVIPRDKSQWKMKEAVGRLNAWLPGALIVVKETKMIR